ncbi:hypothetical protein A2191_03325 [Candidatus Woesebacteria bacterium RIFOXYA1_FULL_38_9]|nr:MAG: hypothetical protein A2191_03325 [Candidatus Woesebacteria bacterium RIFOXYA1_FULL_38_9]
MFIIYYSQQGSLKPQFLHMASLLPAITPIKKPQHGHFWLSSFSILFDLELAGFRLDIRFFGPAAIFLSIIFTLQG